MKEGKRAVILQEDVKKHIDILETLYRYKEQASENELKILGRTRSSALIFAGVLEQYYTGLETIFLRISQFFENDLEPDKWHTELLRKMNLKTEGVREMVISDTTFNLLLELLRFRHFKRYYFQLEYDWDRLDFLLKKIDQVHPLVLDDLERFRKFLESI